MRFAILASLNQWGDPGYIRTPKGVHNPAEDALIFCGDVPEGRSIRKAPTVILNVQGIPVYGETPLHDIGLKS